MAWLAAPETLPFGVALGVLIGIAVLEGIGALVAGSPSAWVEQFLPHADTDADGAIDGPLGWLHLGRVPLLVLLILFLFGFSVCGYAVQLLARAMTGSYAPPLLASVPALLAGVAVVRGLGTLLAKAVPRDETSVVSENSLIGRAGTVTIGVARSGMAAQTRVQDTHGRSHYVMVEPDIDGEVFEEGTRILLVRKHGVVFRAIRNPHPELL